MKTIIFEEAFGQLFYDLHKSGLFADGKEISDAVLNETPQQVLASYLAEKDLPDFNLKAFYKAYFSAAKERQSDYVSDTQLSVEAHIEKLWPVLTRQPEDQEDVFSSRVNLPKPYVVPGGRFNEIYYWDSYFTMLGLRESGRVELIENMIDNFSYLIDQYGFIPNGNRTYFRGRSQPPFFALMVELLGGEKGLEAYEKHLPFLEKEYAFWMNGQDQLSKDSVAYKRVVLIGEDGFLNRYFDNIPDPRTEMYSDDVELMAHHDGDSKQLMLDIRAACESGWDFSARWCAEPGKLETIHTTDIIPVDLNCLLLQLERVLALANQIVGNKTRAAEFLAFAERRKNLINKLFWNPETSYFHDYDFVKNEQTRALTLAGVFPLFFEVVSPEHAASCADNVETHFLKAGGLITTTFNSGEQWDAPNGWAPLQWICIRGLEKYDFNSLAGIIKTRWLDLNTRVYKNTGKMLEKYNVVDVDLETGGGEYPVQDGFGWTNGVFLNLKKKA